MIKKVKLRDATKEDFAKWKENSCLFSKQECIHCKLKGVTCSLNALVPWIDNKDLYSDKFLDQEIEIEVETTKLSEDEILTLKYFNKVRKCKYIARDSDFQLFCYNEKPKKSAFRWDAEEYACGLDDELFTFIKWEDEEPYAIEDLLKECDTNE